MPWSMSNPPPPAKNWSMEKKRRCIAAANVAMRANKSEREAIFACIGAAKTIKTKARESVSKPAIALYEKEQQRAEKEFEGYAQAYLVGETSLAVFKQKMQEGLKQYYIRIALLAKGEKPFTNRDKNDLSRFLTMIYGYLDKFILDLEAYQNKALASDQGVTHRASSYGYGWGVFSRYTLPGELADMLPELPGLSCLGGENCGCWLEYEGDEEGYRVWWYINPLKHNCPVCLALTADWSPLEISIEEIIDYYGEEVLDEDGNFVEF